MLILCKKQYFSRWLRFTLLLVMVGLGWGLLHQPPVSRSVPNNDPQPQNAWMAPRNTPSLFTSPSPSPSPYYRPVGEWVGRLILPPPSPDLTDWVWFEIHHSPIPSLVGQRLRLQWQDQPQVQAYVQAVQRDISLSNEAHQSLKRGNIHPVRLDGRQQVGPLQSLAGARPTDDVWVSLKQVRVVTGLKPRLEIIEDPVQVAGSQYGLVKILGSSVSRQFIPDHCPGSSPCPSELMRVRHYNPASQGFDGPEEIVRIPQDLPNSAGGFQSTPRQLASSPAGSAGWYLYGEANAQGLFEVSAIAPRALFQLHPDQHLFGKKAGLHAFKRQMWQQSPRQKGQYQRVWVAPNQEKLSAASEQWQRQDQALVVHLFGGIGGNKAEPKAVVGTVTGHFAYGIATVITDPFTQEPQFDLEYQQVYSHNPEGIIAGPIHWAEYMGNLHRGWLGSRPVLDVVIQYDALTQPYQFGAIDLNPLAELKSQLQLMAARYRSGDGTGSALVTPAKSCVQDASQAVYQTIKRLQQKIQTTPAIQTWLATHPNHPQSQRFQQLIALGNALERELVPLGIVRSDWQQNAQVVAGIRGDKGFTHTDTVWTQLLSWRTLIPRVAHNQVITIFLQQGAPLWFLRTNQVGGWDPDIAPLAPTELFGQWPLVSFSFSRLIAGTTTLPTQSGWVWSGVILILYGLIAWPWGYQQGFLSMPKSIPGISPSTQLRLVLKSLFMPALIEEFLFRCLLLPHPQEGVWWLTQAAWSGFSLLIFVLYHPLNARTFYKAGNPTFFNPTFLALAALLGVACTVTYRFTGSIWPGTIIHWIVVVIWLLCLGGLQRLHPPTISHSTKYQKTD